MSCSSPLKFLALLLFTSALSACGMTLSPVKRAPLELQEFKSNIPQNPARIVVVFEDVLPGIPLAETVWDNVHGPFGDQTESKQIGFTQDYSDYLPAAAGAGVLGGAVGGAVLGATAGPELVKTRIVIPFGRLFAETFRTGLRQSFFNAATCYERQCGPYLQASGVKYVVRVRVANFQVWEGKLNHMNLRATVRASVYVPGNMTRPVHVYTAQREIPPQPVGTMLSTSGGFIEGMTQISNNFAQAVTLEVLGDLASRVN